VSPVMAAMGYPLPQRLRNWAKNDRLVHRGADLREAADQIERFETALREIYHLPPHLGPVPNEVLNIVYRALEGQP
jgi:hypothetical protein